MNAEKLNAVVFEGDTKRPVILKKTNELTLKESDRRLL